MAVLRVELYESPIPEVNGVRIKKPAARAMVEARYSGRLVGRGIADDKGRVAVIFAYPPPHDSISPFGSSPAGTFTAGASHFSRNSGQLNFRRTTNQTLSHRHCLRLPDLQSVRT